MSAAEPARGQHGQHFLRSARLAADIVRSAEVVPGDLVLDVGAGTGLLTDALVRAGARVVAVEPDPRLARRLERRSVRVVRSDARQMRLPAERFRVVANPPFHITTALLRRVLASPLLTRADVVVADGLAHKRSAVRPSTRLSVMWGVDYELRMGRRLGRECFRPPPAVSCAVLIVRRRDRPLVPPVDRTRFRRLVDAGFSPSCGPLRRELRGLLPRRALARLGPSATARDLDVYEWVDLFASYRWWTGHQ